MRSEHGPWQRRSVPIGALLCSALLGSCGGEEQAEDEAIAEELLQSLGDRLGETERHACFIDLDGGPRVCRSEAKWQRIAEQACRTRGLALVAYRTFRDCGPGRHRRVAYACCPDRPPPPPMCIEEPLSGDRACRDEMTLWAMAERECAAKMLKLVRFELGPVCGGRGPLYAGGRYTCCP